MIRVAFISFLVLFSSSLIANNVKHKVHIEISTLAMEMNQEVTDAFWINYLKLPEGAWVSLNPVTYDSTITTKEQFYLMRNYAKKICNYLSNEGLNPKNVKIEYRPTPHVVVYKPKGEMVYANFVYDDPKNKQVFMVDNTTGSVCETKAGNRINFPPGAFKTSGGTNVQVEVYEYQKLSDFVKSGYTSTANEKLISSSGMFNIKATCNGKSATLNKNRGCNINIAKDNFTDTTAITDFQTFYGDNSDEAIDWKPSYASLTDRRASENNNNLNQSKYRVKRTVTVTERYYVSICYNLPILEPRYNTLNKTTAEEDLLSIVEGKSIAPKCDYNKADYDYIITKYTLQKRTGKMETTPIKSFSEFSKLMRTKRRDVFLELTPEQNKDLVAAKKGYKKAREKKQEELAKLASDAEEVAKARKKAELKKFPIAMKIDQLGRINCDRFMDADETTDIIVKLSEFDFEEIRVYAVFNDIKSVIPAKYYAGSSNGFVTIQGLPINKDVVYIAATFKGDEVKLAYVNKKIAKDDVVALDLTTYPKDKYEAIMDDLIPN